ncbi:MAG: hypothetical protein ABL925_17690 [Methylococcales bacterium]
MALINNNVFQAAANLTLWFKTYTNEALTLADMPEILPLRWTYFRENWKTLRPRLVNQAQGAKNPDYFRFVLDDLTDFIERQRQNTADVNPFASNDVYFRFYPVFDNLKLQNITLTNNERSIVTNKQRALQSYAKKDFLQIKKILRDYRDVLADTAGLNDDDYDAIYDRAPVRQQGNAASSADFNLMHTVERQLGTVDFILANLFAIDAAIDPFALARFNANNPNIDIGQYGSGRLIKLHFGENLPGIARRVFGNPDKWIDIAIANGLKEPYIDETGVQLFFLANGNGNQINLSPRDTLGAENISRFFINQIILINSSTLPFPSQRLITGIKQIPVSGEIILTVNGESNLSSYLLADNASIRVFKPNTINSSQYILIPSEQPLSNTRTEEIPWFLASGANDEKNTKIDLAVDENGALLSTASGDMALSYGLDNAIQAIRAKMLTELGSNSRHPGFGLINLIGTSTNQSEEAKAALIKSINQQIAQDARFDRVQSLSVTRNTNTDAVAYDVALVVKLTGSATLLPITFTVNS